MNKLKVTQVQTYPAESWQGNMSLTIENTVIFAKIYFLHPFKEEIALRETIPKV